MGFSSPFDADLAGGLGGRRSQADYSFLFKDGECLRLRNEGLVPEGFPFSTPKAWDLPAHWTNLDAVFPGGGEEIDFAYFVRGDECCRFDWSTARRSPGYPKKLAGEWNMPPGFHEDLDGAVSGHGAHAAKVYLFKTLTITVDDAGNPVPAWMPGSTPVRSPSCVRYDFDARRIDLVVTNPADLVEKSCGLLPLLDAGTAADAATHWCDRGLEALVTGEAGGAMARHFKTDARSCRELEVITTRLTAVRARIASMPDRFRYAADLSCAARTAPATLTEIGDSFSTRHGPKGRSALMIREAVRFTHVGGAAAMDSAAEEAVTNPGSYAAFAQEVALGAEQRLGKGRPQE